MAVRISLNEITDEQKKIIRKQLYLQPKRTNYSVNRYSSVEKDPVLFYWIDKPNNEIVLPYTFANTLFKRHINGSLDYPLGKFDFTGTLREKQIPVVKKAMEQLNTRGTTTLLLPTGFGKSITAAYLSCQLGGLVLVLTNRETIQKGWISTFKDHTNAGIWVVESKMKVPSQCNVIITMDGKFTKIPEEIRRMVSVFVIDEAHMLSTASQVPVLLGTCPKYVIACTATLKRPDEMERMIYNIVGLHNVEVKNEKKFTVYKLSTGVKTEIEKNKQGVNDFSKLVKKLALDPVRNAFIIDLIEKNQDHKIMVLSWSKDHCKFLYEILKSRNESVDYLVGTKSSYIDSRILLGSMSKVSTGFDSKNVAIDFDGIDISMLILTGSTKSFNMHIQSIGRAFRSESPVIVDLVDDNPISDKHWKARRKNYRDMNCEINEIIMKKRGEDKEDKEDKIDSPIDNEDIKNVHSSFVESLRNRLK